MAYSPSTNCKIYIGGTGDLGAESGWQEIVGVEDMPGIGDVDQIISFDTLDNGRTQKLKGQSDAGDETLLLAYDAADAGQLAVRAAAADKGALPYNFKIELNDQITPTTGNVTDGVFKAFVTSFKLRPGSANQEVRAEVALAITTGVTITDAA